MVSQEHKRDPSGPTRDWERRKEQRPRISLVLPVTRLQVPVMYAIFVLDFKILKWETPNNELPATPIDTLPLHKPTFG